ncbi:unnamed protein product [Paramecium sonneborni]|uniref:Uncharacterized protein n=1 Tax=Paramecium sonneborni TaxID=65129 RepID=A0A8S1PWZ7_9CILI|nr:unnamed protein product [Paramecium sonneborni]
MNLYIQTPSIVVGKIEQREIISLDKDECVNVRDTRTSQVSAMFCESNILKSYEDLWAMKYQLMLIYYQHIIFSNRRVPFNTAVQINDYKTKKTRIILSPALDFQNQMKFLHNYHYLVKHLKLLKYQQFINIDGSRIFYL